MQDLMLDLETLGTNSNALIVQIGACFFNWKTAEIGEQFTVNVSISDGLKNGFEIDSGTLHFWFEQTKRTFLEDTVSVFEALNALSTFNASEGTAKRVWSHATFDFPLIANACNRVNRPQVFRYMISRDIRTVVDLAGIRVKNSGVERKDAHDALADCVYQVGYVSEAIKKLGGF